MKSPINRIGLWACKQATVAVTASIIVFAVAAAANSSPKQEGTVSGIENLRSQEPRTRNAAVDAILRDRTAMIENLILLIDPANTAKYSDETRCAAAYLLGELRAVEAVPVLSRALVDEPGPKTWSDISRYDLPVLTAIVKIGRPAVPVMIKSVETSDHRILRIKSLQVLNHVLGGKRRLLELLTKLEDRANDKEIRRRIGECLTWSREHFREDKEPLY